MSPTYHNYVSSVSPLCASVDSGTIAAFQCKLRQVKAAALRFLSRRTIYNVSGPRLKRAHRRRALVHSLWRAGLMVCPATDLPALHQGYVGRTGTRNRTGWGSKVRCAPPPLPPCRYSVLSAAPLLPTNRLLLPGPVQQTERSHCQSGRWSRVSLHPSRPGHRRTVNAGQYSHCPITSVDTYRGAARLSPRLTSTAYSESGSLSSTTSPQPWRPGPASLELR